MENKSIVAKIIEEGDLNVKSEKKDVSFQNAPNNEFGINDTKNQSLPGSGPFTLKKKKSKLDAILDSDEIEIDESNIITTNKKQVKVQNGVKNAISSNVGPVLTSLYSKNTVETTEEVITYLKEKIELKVAGDLTKEDASEYDAEIAKRIKKAEKVSKEQGFKVLESERIIRSGNSKETNEQKRSRLDRYSASQKKEIQQYGEAAYVGRFRHSEFYLAKEELFGKDIQRVGNRQSEEMATFTSWVEQLSDMWDERFEPDITDEAFDAKALLFLRAYDEAIAAGNTYISKKNPLTTTGKRRQTAVHNMLTHLKGERLRMQTAIDQYRMENPQEKAARRARYGTWADLLFDIRAEELSDSFKEAEHGGTGSTKKIKIEGKEYYFKRAEFVESKKFNTVSKFITYYEKNFSENYLTYIKSLQKVIYYLNGVKSKAAMQFADKLLDNVVDLLKGDKLNTAAKNIVRMKGQTYKYLPQYDGDSYFEDVYELAKLLSYDEVSASRLKAKDREKRDDYIKHHAIYGAKLRMQGIASASRVVEGSSLSNRSIATSRVANQLGMGNLVVNSRSCYVKTTEQGKPVFRTGILMEKAEGMTVSDLHEQLRRENKENGFAKGDPNAPQIYWSQDATKQYLRLMLLDIICGQGDRHSNNFMASYEKLSDGSYLIKSIKGIDNDMSFGRMGSSDIQVGYNRTIPLFVNYKFNISQIDKETYDAIQGLMPKTLRYILADLGLAEEDLKAAENRLIDLQNFLEMEALNHDDFILQDGKYELETMSDLLKDLRDEEKSSIRTIAHDKVLQDGQLLDEEGTKRIRKEIPEDSLDEYDNIYSKNDEKLKIKATESDNAD